MTSEELADRLINFAARVGKVVDALPDTRMGRYIAGQFVRSHFGRVAVSRLRLQFALCNFHFSVFNVLPGTFSQQPLSSDLRAASRTNCVR